MQIILGAILALAALFAGGCSLVFLYWLVHDLVVYGTGLGSWVLIPVGGLSAGGFLGWLAWLLLLGREAGPPPGGGEG
jgi:hypothetical protein